MGFWKRYPKYVLEINFIFYRNKLIVRSSSSRTYSQTGVVILLNQLSLHYETSICQILLVFSKNIFWTSDMQNYCSALIVLFTLLQNEFYKIWIKQKIRPLILKLISRPLLLTSKYNNNRQLNLENLDSLKLSNNFLHRFRNPVVALDSWPVWPDTRSFKLTTNF